MNTKYGLSGCLLTVVMLALSLSSMGEENSAKHVETSLKTRGDLFIVGETHYIQVMLPKRGFCGCPNEVGVGYPCFRGASADDDFSKRYARLTVERVRAKASFRRAVLRLDEIDSKGKEKIRGLYYIYIDVEEKSQKAKVIARGKDDNSSISDFCWGSVKMGLPCPFGGTLPPKLVFIHNPKTYGYMDKSKQGWVYEKVKKDLTQPRPQPSERSAKAKRDVDLSRKETNTGGSAEPPKEASVKKHKKITSEYPLTVKLIMFEKLYGDGKGSALDIKNYDPLTMELVKAPSKERIKVIVKYQETQIWDKPGDWLWSKMVRRNKQGHISMRCMRLKGEALRNITKKNKDSTVQQEHPKKKANPLRADGK